MKRFMRYAALLVFFAACNLSAPGPADPPSTEQVVAGTQAIPDQTLESPPPTATWTSVPQTETAEPTQTPSATTTPTETPVPTQTFTPEPTFTPTVLPGSGRTEPILRDVTYCSPGGADQRLDLYFPAGDDTPSPTVLHIHGGGLTTGDKATGAGIIDISHLVEAGFVVASVNYRLFPPNQFPAHLEDVQCAVRFLRANAIFYNLDPQRIGVFGTSAGGYLAAMLGLTQPGDGFDNAYQYPGYSSQVRAVVSMFGIFKLIAEGDPNAGSPWGPITPQTAARYSATTYADANDPPVLLFHGDLDQVVSLAQSQAMHDAIVNAGGQVTFLVVKNGRHGFEPTSPPMEPGRLEITQTMIQFFNQHLR